MDSSWIVHLRAQRVARAGGGQGEEARGQSSKGGLGSDLRGVWHEVRPPKGSAVECGPGGVDHLHGFGVGDAGQEDIYGACFMRWGWADLPRQCWGSCCGQVGPFGDGFSC